MKNCLFALGLIGILTLSSCLGDNDTLSTAEQYEKEQKAIDAYIEENNLTGVEQDSLTELRYRIITEGSGAFPKDTDWVDVSYSGSVLSTGVVFDSGDSVYFRLQNLIPGWRILLPHVKVGGTIQMFIPSYYAYGMQSIGAIPANSTLIFEVTLNEIGTRFDYDQYRIDNYIEENELTHQVDTVEGLRYTILEEGSGDYPTDTSSVNVDYQGLFLNGNPFIELSGAVVDIETFSVSGWRILMPYIREGSTAYLYVPSKFAYGENGASTLNIPPNTPLIYKVTLNSIVD